MYKCYECGYVFSTPIEFTEDQTPGGAFEGGSFLQRFTGCPKCQGAYGEATQCDFCGEWDFIDNIASTSFGDLCNLCYDEMSESLED